MGNHPKLSVWERESFFSDIDIAIIGSGIVGLSAALYLKDQQRDLNVAIFERGPLPAGASTRNAGFACFGSISELAEDLKTLSEDEVFALVEKRWRGLQQLKQRVGPRRLGLKQYGGYELFMDHEEDAFRSYRDQFEYFNHQLSTIIPGEDIFREADGRIADFGFQKVQHLIYNSAEAQIHTGQMMKALLEEARDRGIPVFNGLGVRAIEAASDDVMIQLHPGWTLRAGKVLVATNGFVRKLLPELAVSAARNQVLITRPVPGGLRIRGTFQYDKGYYYFRNLGDRLLFGGARNVDLDREMTDQFGLSQKIQDTLLTMLREVILPDTTVEVDHWWSGILGVGTTKKPIVRKIHERIAVAVRLGGMGVAIGSLVGEEGAELLL